MTPTAPLPPDEEYFAVWSTAVQRGRMDIHEILRCTHAAIGDGESSMVPIILFKSHIWKRTVGLKFGDTILLQRARPGALASYRQGRPAHA